MTVRIETLGGLRVLRDMVEVERLPAQRIRAALLTLVAYERRIARERVTHLFWSERPAALGRQSLRQALHLLSQDIGKEWIDADRVELRASELVSLDALELKKAVAEGEFGRAVELYRGPFLDGVPLAQVPEWDHWVDRRRTECAQAFRVACRNLVVRHIEAGRPRKALEVARTWTTPDPLDDEAQHALIEALTRLGHRSEATRTYEQFARRLEAEDLRPLDETRDLYERLMSGDVQASFPTARPPTRNAGRSTVPTAVPAIDDAPGDASRRSRPWRAGVLGLALLAAVAVIVRGGDDSPLATLDEGPTRLVATGFANSLRSVDWDPNRLFRDALSYWTDYEQPSLIDWGAEAETRDEAPSSLRDAQRIGASLGTSQFVVGEASEYGDSVRVEAVLYETASASTLGRATVRFAISDQPSPRFADLVGRLLHGSEVPRIPVSPTRSSRALGAFHAGVAAAEEWDLEEAQLMFDSARAADPSFSSAWLWLALVRFWNGEPSSRWELPTRRSAIAGSLDASDASLRQALVAAAEGEFGAACPQIAALTEELPARFYTWVTYAECLRRDRLVLPNPESPSGYTFRSGHATMARAYQEAFVLRPGVHRSRTLGASSHEGTRSLFATSTTTVRFGLGADGSPYYAYPSFHADSLAYYPVPTDGSLSVPEWHDWRLTEQAVLQQRALFLRIAQAWSATYQRSSQAKEALAVALELVGKAGAVDTLRAAKLLPTASPVRLDALEAWLTIKFSLPHDTAGLRNAVALARTTLDSAGEPLEDPYLLPSLAAVLGQPSRGAGFLDASPATGRGITGRLGSWGPQALLYNALGGPPDALGLATRRLVAEIESAPDSGTRTRLATEWMGRAESLAFPETPFARYREWISPDPLLSAQRAALSGDTLGVRSVLDDIDRGRIGVDPSALTIDAIYSEAVLQLSVGDSVGARDRLGSTLDAVGRTAPRVLIDVTRAGTLIQSIALRAELEIALGNADTGRLWAACAAILLEDSEPFLHDLRDRVTRLGASP